jgi:hypothetical protein
VRGAAQSAVARETIVLRGVFGVLGIHECLTSTSDKNSACFVQKLRFSAACDFRPTWQTVHILKSKPPLVHNVKNAILILRRGGRGLNSACA